MGRLRVARVIESQLAPVTPTLIVRRALPDAARGPALKSVGPWVFLDHFGPVDIAAGDMGTPPHPHAGIATVTYLFEGGMHHRDSAGHHGSVGANGVQWMTAGRGIVHAERPAPGRLHGLQLWTRLPRARQLREPGYVHFEAAQIRSFAIGDAAVRLVSGSLAGETGPAAAESPTLLAHLSLPVQGKVSFNLDPGAEAAIYVASGSAVFEGTVARTGQLVVLDAAIGGEVILSTAAEGAELILLGGAPVDGPLVFHGPFVLDSVAAIRQAERDFHEGRMGALAA